MVSGDPRLDQRGLERAGETRVALDLLDRAHFVAVHAADEQDLLAGLRALRDDDGQVPVLARAHLHALEVEAVLLPGLEVVHVERADHAFPWITSPVYTVAASAAAASDSVATVARTAVAALMYPSLKCVASRPAA
jgi:hypothetical protein